MKDKSTQTIAITGITGSQGGAAARALLQEGWKIRGLTRNPKRKQAAALADLGAVLIQGNMGDPEALERLFDGVYGVYGVTDFFRNGIDKEIEHGKLIADTAKKTGVKHLIFASAASSDQDTGIPHFDSKWQIEQHIETLGIPATILRPTIFMEDLTEMKYFPPGGWGMMMKIIGPQRPLKWIAVDSIGAVAAAVFADPDTYIGKKIPLVGDTKSIAEARDIFKKVDGKTPFKISMPVWLFRRMVSKELTLMYEWLSRHDLEGDIDAVRKIHPDLMDMETWLKNKRKKGRK